MTMDGNAALDAAMAMAGNVATMGEGAPLPNAMGSRSKEVMVEHIDYKYVDNCSDPMEIERILAVARSGKYGRFEHLEFTIENKLRNLKPGSSLLKKTVPASSLDELTSSDRKDLLSDLAGWSSNMESAESERSDPPQGASQLPPVRGCKAQASYPEKPESAADNSKPKKKAIPGGDFRAWDKFDIDAALDEIDTEEVGEVGGGSISSQAGSTVTKERTIINSSRRLPASKISKKPNTESERRRVAATEKDKGNECYKSGDYDEAIVYYSRSLDMFETAAAFNNRALALLKCKKYRKAMEDTARVLDLEPGNIKALARQCNALKGLKRLPEALEAAERILSLQPTNKEGAKLKAELEKKLQGQSKPDAPSKKRMVIEEVGSEDEDEGEGVSECVSTTPVVPVAHSEFQPAASFSGSKPGFVFHMGKHGLGYYRDPVGPAPAPAPTRRLVIEEDSEESSEEEEEEEEGKQVFTEKAPAAPNSSKTATRPPAAGVGSRRVVIEEEESDDDENDAKITEVPSPEPPARDDSAVPVEEPAPRNDATPAAVLAAKDKGKDLFLQGHYGDAATEYNHALELLGASDAICQEMEVTLHSNLAACFQKTGECRRAIQECDSALAIDKSNVKVLLRRAMANETLERYRKAYVDYQSVVLGCPGNLEASRGASRSMKCVQELEGNEWLREQRTKIVPCGSPRTARAQARPQASSQSAPSSSGGAPSAKVVPNRAPASAKSVLEPSADSATDPKLAYDALKAQGNSFVKKKQFEKAAECYTRCIELDSTAAAAYNNRSLCYIRLEKWELALADTKKVITLEPTNAKALFRQGQALAATGAGDDAVKLFDRVLDIDPANIKAKEEKTTCELRKIQRMREEMELNRATVQKQVADLHAKVQTVESDVLSQKEALVTKEAELKKAGDTIDGMKATLVEEASVELTEIAAKVEAGAQSKAKAPSAGTERATTPAAAEAVPPKMAASAKHKAVASAKLTPVQFMRQLSRGGPAVAKVLSTVAVGQLPKLFSNRLEADHVVSVLRAAKKMDAEPAFDLLRGMVTVQRFEMTVMFLEDKDREVANGVFERVRGAIADGSDFAIPLDEIARVASKYN